MTNRLGEETSLYLLQHAENPVDWYPWGEDAFKKAKSEDKPILLSIGYSACHWCHVMNHECFENKLIAEIMNKNFVNIKVDKEEHPEIDNIYMEAVKMLSGTGGWPLTVFLTPEGVPFYGGTYFPPEDAYGLPGFKTILLLMAEAYSKNRTNMESVGSKVVELINNISMENNLQDLNIESLDRAFISYKEDFDNINGGFGLAPKFPVPMILDALLRYYYRTNNKYALNMVELTLEKMAKGGIYDQIGGGFHRYATDNKWLIPHFEKMLYDNALLAKIYLDAYIVTGKHFYRVIVEETIDYILREMTSPDGGFYSSQDADSEGIEGTYYLWTRKEIEEAVGLKYTDKICKYFGVTDEGNFNGKNILYIADDIAEKELLFLKNIKHKLLLKREERLKPVIDKKIIASWNGLMLSTVSEVASILSRDDYKDKVIANAQFLLDAMVVKNKLKRVFSNGEAKIEGQLQDYACLIQGLLSLHKLTCDIKWAQEAINLAKIMVDKFWDNDRNILFDLEKNNNELIVRPRHIYDDSIPSGISMATNVLLQVGIITGQDIYLEIAEKSLKSVISLVNRIPEGFAYWVCLLDFYLAKPLEIAFIVENDDITLLDALNRKYLPNKVFIARRSEEHISGIALLNNKFSIDNKSTIYICENYSCKAPVNDSQKLEAELEKER